MAREITIAEVDQAEAEFLALKKKAQAKSATNATRDEYKEMAREFAELRSAYRFQEEQAGRRVGLVGGDATPEG